MSEGKKDKHCVVFIFDSNEQKEENFLGTVVTGEKYKEDFTEVIKKEENQLIYEKMKCIGVIGPFPNKPPEVMVGRFLGAKCKDGHEAGKYNLWEMYLSFKEIGKGKVEGEEGK